MIFCSLKRSDMAAFAKPLQKSTESIQSSICDISKMVSYISSFFRKCAAALWDWLVALVSEEGVGEAFQTNIQRTNHKLYKIFWNYILAFLLRRLKVPYDKIAKHLQSSGIPLCSKQPIYQGKNSQARETSISYSHTFKAYKCHWKTK